MMMTCLQYLQLTKLRDHLRNPEMSSDEYRYNCRYSTVQYSTVYYSTVQYKYPCRKMFWRMIIVHSCLGALVLGTACLLSAGYALTCRNMYLVVEKEIRSALVSTI